MVSLDVFSAIAMAVGLVCAGMINWRVLWRRYHVRACASACGAFSDPSATWTVNDSTVPPTPISISGPIPIPPCFKMTGTYTINWTPANNQPAGTDYDLHETNDLLDSDPEYVDQILQVSGTSKQLSHDKPRSSVKVMYFYEVRACAVSGGSRQCSAFLGKPQVCISTNTSGGESGPQQEVSSWATAYDPFGKVREGDFTDHANGTLNLLPMTLRGFTAQQHVDDVQLIHMNGRVYDYQLGRFLSVDPFIQNPANSQSLNPYSYIGNNPLSGKDPTGYEAEGDETPKKEPDPDLANKIDGFKVVANYGKSRGNQGTADNGATHGQSATSTKTAAAADAGNPTTDPGSQVNGNPASPNNNGGNAIPGMPTLPTVGVNVNANGDSTVPGDWSTSMNGRILSAENAQYNDEKEARIANSTLKGLAWEAYGKPAISVGLGMYAGALIADVMYLGEGTGYGASVSLDLAGEGENIATTTVGRWMSKSELNAMIKTGRVQESFNNGVTSVTVPPNPGLYRAAPNGDIFTRFNVPTSSLNSTGTGIGKIYGPSSIFGPRLGITEMPPATNIVVPK